MDVEGQRWMWESRIFWGGMIAKYLIEFFLGLKGCSDSKVLRSTAGLQFGCGWRVGVRGAGEVGPRW